MAKITNSILDKTFRYSLKLAKQYYFNQLAKQDIVCPTFGTELVSVTREGWEHLAHAKRKSKLDVFGRFFVLELVRSLLETAQQATYYRKTDSIEYWGFEGVVDDIRLRVIIRAIDGGGKHLYSVIRLGMI